MSFIEKAAIFIDGGYFNKILKAVCIAPIENRKA